MSGRTASLAVAAIVLCLALALAGQAAADALVPEADGVTTGRIVGQAAFSYITGLRTFAAAVLWNRLEPILHGYYEGVPLEQQRYILSTIAVVEELDPHLQQPFYIGSWVLARNGRVDAALEMAERGVAENPRSGLLLTNLAQIQNLYGKDLEAAAKTAERALAPDIVWADVFEKHNSYPILGAVLRAGGRDDLDRIVQAELERLDAEYGSQLPSESHDHDGDGHPDHE